ncbi:EAL domain-containing protein [Virgibacillus doumboii]|uniref:EAL domain-containing protein n=1 Tax=Virgibacillus doumboii TaxID=2697503 RepID=UPI0013E07B6F|nr:EAL domain-containing protein [Virgibacillus doumboii]
MNIFINVFPATLLESSFYILLQRMNSFIDTDSRNIVFELNEVEKDMDLSKIKLVVNEIRKKGFLIALDDIGKGESTLKSILEIKPDIAKVDKHFAKDLAESPKKQKALKLILNLFGGDTEVILEGFESKADLDIEKDMGVSLGRAFY